jgi:RNA polymerase sigma-70 factor (sigma-E family)
MVVAKDKAEFAAFYLANRDICLRAVAANVPDRQLAEDLVADAFAKAWVSWQRVSLHPAPRAWVVRTALNTRVSWWRRRWWEVLAPTHESIASDDLRGGVDEPLLSALRHLPYRQREVVALRVLLDLDTEATAKVLGIAPGTVMVHLSRAVAALRRELGEPNSEPNTIEVTK